MGDVSGYGYYQVTPAYNISGIISMPGGNVSGVSVTCLSSPSPFASTPLPLGFFSRTVLVDASGNHICAGLPENGDYLVRPSKQGFNFTPHPQLTALVQGLRFNISGWSFIGSVAPTYTISGRVTNSSGTTGVSNVSLALTGYHTGSAMTDANGNYVITGVTHAGSYTLTPSKANITFAPASQSFSNLSGTQTANFTATSLLQLILEESGPDPNQVAALDSMIFFRDPLQVIDHTNLLNPGPDRNTRVAIFVSNFQPVAGEPPASVVIHLIGSNNFTYDIPADSVTPVPNFGFTQIVFRLPDSLSPGTCTVTVKAHGEVSNSGTLRIAL